MFFGFRDTEYAVELCISEYKFKHSWKECKGFSLCWIASFYSLIMLAIFEIAVQGGVITEDEEHTFIHEMSS